MSYKVKVPSPETFSEIASLLKNRVKVHAYSEGKGFLSTDEIPQDLKENLVRMGATIVSDFQYTAE